MLVEKIIGEIKDFFEVLGLAEREIFAKKQRM
jgi:hypothetical protein